MRKLVLLTVLAGTLAFPATALAAPELQLSTSHVSASGEVAQGTYVIYEVMVFNPGDEPTSAGDITVDLSVPAGLEIVGLKGRIKGLAGQSDGGWSCEVTDTHSGRCTGPAVSGFSGESILLPINPGAEACKSPPFRDWCRIQLTVKANPEAALGEYTPTITACGGSVTVCPTPAHIAPDDPIEVVPFELALTGFDGRVLDEAGEPETQAGGRPHTAATEFSLRTYLAANGQQRSTDQLKDTQVELPPGLVGNPQAYPTCGTDVIARGNGNLCPVESRVGTAVVHANGPFGTPDNPDILTVPVYNLEVPFGLPALFGFNILENVVKVTGEVRSGEDYGVTVTSVNAPQTLDLAGVDFEFWGVPADPAHDPERCINELGGFFECDSEAPLRPFVSLPTSCTGPVETSIEVTGWLGGSAGASFLSHDNAEPPNPIGNDGCGDVPFDPSLEARPTTNAGDAPSGFDVSLKIPQSEECKQVETEPSVFEVLCDPATAHLKDTTVTLPEGLVVNPSSANGLGACSEAQIGYTSTGPDGAIHTTPDPARCPDDSKLGTVEVQTPLLDHPIDGAVYLAQPHQNPFGSLIALYIAVHDRKTETVVKLAGEVSLDQGSGRITATFKQNPQLPFEEFRLRFFGGAGGSLRTPAICGNHTTASSLTPWSAPAGQTAHPSDTWAITQSCSGSPAQQPHAPSFDAGSASPIAGAHSPFAVNLRRADGSQQFSAVTVTPPPGLTAKLAGTPACPDAALAAAASRSGQAENAAPSCPLSSRVGSVVAAAGAGPAPYHAGGEVYLAGPYKGAPLSLATVVPATAGPFALGTVVTRIAAHVNPATAEITAISDPIPHILQGVPLDVRTVSVALDRPGFSLNPTNCDPMAATGQLTSTLGALAPLHSRFQLAECRRLGFKPRMSLHLKGGTRRAANPALTTVLRPRPGDANIRRLSVKLPRSAFLDQAHIRTVCTRVQWAADQCPRGSIYGTIVAHTPLLDYPLRGNVYLRSSDNQLPDLVPDLRGPAHQPIRVESAGRTDSVKGALRNSFAYIPDAPISRVVLRLFGGKRGLIVNSRGICQGDNRALVKFSAHNGARHTIRPKLRNPRCKKGTKRSKAKRSSHRRSNRAAAAGRTG